VRQAIASRDVWPALAEALGISKDNVVAVTVALRVDEPACITIESYVTAEQGKALTTELKRYELVEKKS
jgi:hypothetical protein